jgi:hypothetical protein
MNKLLVADFDDEPAADAGLKALRALHAAGDITLDANGVAEAQFDHDIVAFKSAIKELSNPKRRAPVVPPRPSFRPSSRPRTPSWRAGAFRHDRCSPTQAAAASAASFSVGAVWPIADVATASPAR